MKQQNTRLAPNLAFMISIHLIFGGTEGFTGEIWAIKFKKKVLSSIHKYFITIA
jgi:hypothetical protein